MDSRIMIDYIDLDYNSVKLIAISIQTYADQILF